MEGSLGDRHDETVYYVSSHWDELAVKNVLKLQKLTVFFAVVYFLYLVLAYVIVKTFNLRLSYFSVPLYILFFWKIADILRRRPDMKAWLSRVVVFAFFAGLSYIVSYVDAVTYSSSPTVLFPLVLMSVAAFYVDYFWVMAGLEFLMTIVFCLATISLRGIGSMPEGLCIALAALTVSLYSYWHILTEYTDRAYDNRVLKDEGSRDLLTGLLNKVSFEREVRNYLNSRKLHGRNKTIKK